MILAALAYYYEPFYLYFGLGACALAFGDSTAALVGKKWGKYTLRLPFNKSLAGLLAFVVFTPEYVHPYLNDRLFCPFI